MTKMVKSVWLCASIVLSGCSLTPEQQAEREHKRVKAEQNLQIRLAKQCDAETAELIETKFNPPLSRTEEEKKVFEKRYLDKVENPVFQACYKLALENYKAQQEIEYLRYHYENERPRWGMSRFCYLCE